MIKQENVRAIILFGVLVYGSITSTNNAYILLTQFFPSLSENILFIIFLTLVLILINAFCIYGILRLPALITNMLNSFLKHRVNNK